jgi:hypothetical protein
MRLRRLRRRAPVVCGRHGLQRAPRLLQPGLRHAGRVREGVQATAARSLVGDRDAAASAGLLEHPLRRLRTAERLTAPVPGGPDLHGPVFTVCRRRAGRALHDCGARTTPRRLPDRPALGRTAVSTRNPGWDGPREKKARCRVDPEPPRTSSRWSPSCSGLSRPTNPADPRGPYRAFPDLPNHRQASRRGRLRRR